MINNFSVNDNKNSLYMKACLFVFLVIILAFSPLISAILSIFLLLIMGERGRNTSLIIAIMAMLSLVFILSSRGTLPDGEGNDDVNNYYQTFNNLLEYNYSAFFTYGKGLEVGLPSYLYMVGKFFGHINKNQLMYFVNIPVGLAFLFWFHRFSSRIIPRKFYALILSGLIIFYSYGPSNLLLRQYCSSVILLYALSANSRCASYILLSISAAFHVTAIPFYFLYFIFTKNKCGDYILFIFFVLACLSISVLGDYASHVGLEAISSKLNYYSPSGEGVEDVDSAIRVNKTTLILLSISTLYISGCAILSVVLSNKGIVINKNARSIFLMLLCTIISFKFAWFPTRIFLIPVFFLLPIIIYNALYVRSYLLLQILFLVLLLHRIIVWSDMTESSTSLWSGYSWWGGAFYYL